MKHVCINRLLLIFFFNTNSAVNLTYFSLVFPVWALSPSEDAYLSLAVGFTYKFLFLALLLSFILLNPASVSFPWSNTFLSCLLGRQAWLLGSVLPFKCCFYCSTVTDHWPETGVVMEALHHAPLIHFSMMLIEKVIFSLPEKISQFGI